MARPKTNTVEYFYHPCKDGDKMSYMETIFGDKGYVAYYKLLQRLGRADGHFLDFNDSQIKMFYQKDIRADDETVTKIIKAFIDLKVIDKELFEKNGIIWCQDFVDRLTEVYNKRGRELPVKPSFRDENNTSVNESGTETAQSKVKESIVEERKESKVNNSIELRAKNFAEKLKPLIDNPYNKQLLLDFYDYWTEPTQNLKKLKFELQKTWDLNRRLKTWARNEEKYGARKQSGQGQTNYHSTKTDVSELVAQTRAMLG